jgi:proteasome lid subunit RPN8/RPN11
MIRINSDPWQAMLHHAHAAYPRECCGLLLGTLTGDDERVATVAIPCRNAYEGDQSDRFTIDPADQLAAQKRARAEDLEVLGFFHSHPDCDAYFSATDLANSWPWYSNVVLSVKDGQFSHAACFRANDDQTQSTEEQLIYG